VKAGIPVAPHAAVRSRSDLAAALDKIGLPAVIKTADSGYDGKGQAMLNSPEDAERVWPQFASVESVVEAKIDFACELSVIAVRGADGQFAAYGPVLNSHSRHILDTSVMPYPFPPAVCRESIAIAETICRELDVIGVLCVEFFLDRQDRLLVNELAPRPHNSGHLTIDACETCQFEQQVRALCGWQLGSTRQHTPAAMANLLGDLWTNGEPHWERLPPSVKLHLYGKTKPQPGRKMGHLTALASTAQEALKLAEDSRALLV
jgi:5-(carboxyamino)imidazole ribonucleotide synthase